MCAYTTVVSLVMSPNHPNDDLLNQVDASVKLFLSFVEELDNNIVKDNENKIELASCFVNLLGIKDIMMKFGVFQNFWEGGLRGKGIFMPLKDSINRGFHSKGLCKRVLTQQYHSMIIEDLIGFEENIDSFLSFHERNNNQMNDCDDDLIGANAPDQFHKDRY